MKYSTITSANIRAFLQFFARKVGKSFDEETFKKWEALDDEKRDEFLNRMLDSFGYDTDIPKLEVIREFQNSEKNSDSSSSSSSAFNPFPSPVSTEKAEKKKASSRKMGYWIGIILLVIFLVATAYLWSKYSEYNNRDRVYCIASNLTVRQDLSSNDKWPTRMDLYGDYMSSGGEVQKSYSSLPLVDKEKYNEYYKVYMDTSFIQYLTDQEKLVGYVHSSYVTTKLKEYENFQEIFKHFAEDYNELQNLPVRYRRIIVNTIQNYPSLNGKVLSPPCYKDKNLNSNAKMSIAHITVPSGISKLYYVICRIDGQYYTLQSNPDATEIALAQTMLVTQSGESEMQAAGKFGYDKSGILWWYDCKSDLQASVNQSPYDVFREKGLSENPSSPIDDAVDYIMDNIDDVVDAVTQ